MELKSIIYLSTGNLPSKMAHSTQIAKMAQALSQRIEEFELVTSGDIGAAFRGMDSEFKNWYGLYYNFRLVRLPLHVKINYPFSAKYQSQIYYKLAALYACLKSPSLIYTRTAPIVNTLLKIGVPVVWEWHEFIRDDYTSDYCQFFNNENLLGVVTTLPQLAENYIKHGLAPQKILVAPNAVDLGNFLPYQEKNLARQKLSFPQNAKIILYSGHLYNYKRIPTILETARLLPEYEFVLVGGWDDDINRVKEDCQKNDLRNVCIVGHVTQSELPSYLYSADVLILPTSKYWDLAAATCPLKLFDYMVSKRPIVASALPTVMTVLRDKQNALLAEPDDPLSFKEAIVKLLDDQTLANTIAENAFQDVQKFTWDTRAQRVLQFAGSRLENVTENVANSRRKLLSYMTSCWL